MEKIDLSLSAIRGQIRDSFPGLHLGNIVLDDSGWDYVVAIINDSIVFRFPRTFERVKRLKKEIRLISFLHDFPFRIPDYSLFSSGDHFFAGYSFIPGIPLNSARTLGTGLISDSVRVLRYLSGYDTSNLPTEEIPVYSAEEWIRGHVEGISREFRSGLSRYLGEEYFEIIDEHLNESLGNLRDSDMRLTHGDLFKGNVLINRRHMGIVGVIDWEDASIGDVALDIAALGKDFPPIYTRRLISALGIESDGRLKERVDFYQWFEPLYTAYHRAQLGDIGGLWKMLKSLPEFRHIPDWESSKSI